MDTLKLKQITGGSLIVAFIMLAFLGIAFTVDGSSGTDYRIAEFREQIYNAQINAADAHESLAKAREVVAAAVEAERKAQAIVDSYSETANAARKAICSIDKESCNNANLDPAGQGVNLQEFFTLAR